MFIRKVQPSEFAMTYDGLFVIASSCGFWRCESSLYVNAIYFSLPRASALIFGNALISRSIIALKSPILHILSVCRRPQIILTVIQGNSIFMILASQHLMHEDSDVFVISDVDRTTSIPTISHSDCIPFPLHERQIVNSIDDSPLISCERNKATINIMDLEGLCIFWSNARATAVASTKSIMLAFSKYTRMFCSYCCLLAATTIAKSIEYIEYGGCHDRVSSRSGSSGMLKHPAPLVYLFSEVY